jgi:hypothetical protein
LCGLASAHDVDRVVGALRSDERLRRAYDRGVAALRLLENAEIASTEIDWVERMLEADGTLGAPAPEVSPKWWWVAAAVGAAAAGVLVLAPRTSAPVPDETFTPRGGPRAEGLALSALCDRDASGGRTPALVEVSDGRCAIDATLGFAVRVDARHRGGAHLVLFGVDGAGDVQYYLPTPDEASVAIVARDRWTPLQRAVRLDVNHGPGALRVYAALLDRPPTVADVDDAAAVLRAAPDDEQTAWIDRLGSSHPWTAQCPEQRCSSARLDLWIDARTP